MPMMKQTNDPETLRRERDDAKLETNALRMLREHGVTDPREQDAACERVIAAAREAAQRREAFDLPHAVKLAAHEVTGRGLRPVDPGRGPRPAPLTPEEIRADREAFKATWKRLNAMGIHHPDPNIGGGARGDLGPLGAGGPLPPSRDDR
jgi:hypothetical protein